MKRVIATMLMLITTVFMGVVSWYYGLKPAIEGNMNFLRTDASPISVTIPLGGTQYVNLTIDGVNTSLDGANELTMWKFNDNRIVRTREHLDGKPVGSGVMYMSNKEVYRQFGDYYVSVSSDERNVGVACESLKTATPYTAPCPRMDEKNQITELPDVTLPTDYKQEGEWRLPIDVEEIIMSKSSDDRSYYTKDMYFNYNFRYQKQDDAIIDAATRVCALSGQGLDWWYLNGDVFIAKAGDEVVCVKQRNYTSCYFISSNDLGYIMLNL